MKNKYITLFPIIVIFQLIKEAFTYNESVPFNFTDKPRFCYVEDFILSMEYRPFVDDIYPVRGCSSDERNKNYHVVNISYSVRLANITFEPSLDYFFNKDEYPPADRDPPTSMTFKIINLGVTFKTFLPLTHYILITFGRSEDYQSIPKISKRTGKPIQFIGNKAILPARIKIVPMQFYQTTEYNYSYSDYEIYDYEGYDFNVTFDGVALNLSGCFEFYKDETFYKSYYTPFAIIVKVYDLPRMKVQGLFQFNCSVHKYDEYLEKLRKQDSIYTVDTRNVFFQNISMFYNQRVNVTNEGLEPTGEDSGFWVKTPCNTIQMATIMVDYHFFDTIHRMQSYGFEFGDRFQLRIHTPYYRKTLTTSFSLFRSQWNTTFPKPRVFIHPISKYKEYCETYKNCTKFDYDEWSTDPKFTKYIIDIKNEIVDNQIWINFTELEKIYEADGFHRGKLVINVNNTMTPHITQIANGLWAELYDTVTNDWVMKTKTNMDEVHGYIDDYEPDPYRNFYLTCEIPDNITTDELDYYIKKYGVLQKAHLWFRIDVYNKGVMKMFPPRLNTIIKFPPEILLNNDSFVYTYQYYIAYNDYTEHWKNNQFVLKDLRQTGVGDGMITNDTFDLARNQLNVSELHANIPNGEDHMFYTIYYNYVCYLYYDEFGNTCFNISIHRQFLYYVYDLNLMYNTNNTGPIDITVYHVKYIPYHSKNQINRGLHRWNQHHAGWDVPAAALFEATAPYMINNKKIKRNSYRPYYITIFDNYYYWNGTGYSNYYGFSFIERYTGPDCVFNQEGGSNLRNRTCEFWAAIMPDKPFSNYARDVVEEHIAYRTLNDNSFNINTSQIRQGFVCRTKSYCPFPGKLTSFFFEIGYFNFSVGRDYEDGEVICHFFYIKPYACARYKYDEVNLHFPILNIHKYPEEFFLRIDLPENLTVQAEYVGLIKPCLRTNPTTCDPWTSDHARDYMCYYVNSSTIYAFNSKTQLGSTNSVNFDIYIYFDRLYYHENSTKLQYYSGLIRWGFLDDPFFYVRFPKPNDTLNYLDFTNATVTLTRDNVTNDGMATLNVSLLFKKVYYKDQIFKFYFGKEIKFADCLNLYFDNKIFSFWELYNNDSQYHYQTLEYGHYIGYDQQAINTYYEIPKDTNLYYLIFPYIMEFLKNAGSIFYVNRITDGGTFQIDITFKIINPRSFKTTRFVFYDFNDDYGCTIQAEFLNLTNTIPQYLYNMTVTPNSYFTGDRAIYKFNYITYMRETLIGDIFEFKTSWKTKYTDNEEDPDENGYYINRITIDQYHNSSEDTNTTLIANFILNPETLETQYIKGIRIYDSEGYLVSVCNDTIPIKMRKISGFKRSELSTEKTEDDNKFDISFEMVPEILIRKNDKLRLKFSSMVSLDEYTECKIDSTKGLSILDPDFKCEIDKDNNEIILYNAFKEIGDSLQIFEYLNSTALTDQQFTLSFKDIPIYSKSNDLENVYAIEIQTENEKGLITQTNLLPSTAIFKCDSRCKTCNEQSPSECLSCNKNYPYFYPNEKYCHKFCPKEKYYIKQNENGNIECLMCEEPCENCLGTATNCTFCSENYFMENNKCVKNCSEGKEKDFILRRCYPITKRNVTVIIDRIIQVNVSVPELYPVYIERNVCMIGGSDIIQN